MEKSSNPNRTRDHLANERTYLAWMRTAIALLGFGIVIVIVIVRLRYGLPVQGRGPVHGWELGLVFCLAGLLAVVGATLHYFHVQRAIETDNYQPEKRWIVACSALVLLVGIGVIWYLVSAG